MSKTQINKYGESPITPTSSSFVYYPKVTDPDFYSKIYHKKEFYTHRQKGYPTNKSKNEIMDEVCRRQATQLELLPQQHLIKNIISPSSPYKNLLVMHGTGSGKTLTGVVVAESFKPWLSKLRVDNPDAEASIYIVASHEAQNNFKDELLFKTNSYLSAKEKTELLRIKNSGNIQLFDEKIKNYYKLLTSRGNGGFYKFIGYQDFQIRIIGSREKREGGRGFKVDSEGEFIRRIKEPRIRNLDNCVLIIDEAHNLVNSNKMNDYGNAVEYIYRHSRNLRLLLLTATPITHRPKEIVRLLNLIRMDQQTPPIKWKELVDNNGILSDKGKQILANTSRGYVSYLRGYNIYTYPKRIEMGVIPPNSEIKYTHLVRCEMSEYQYATYLSHPNPMKVKREDQALLNIVFPNPYNPKIGLFRVSDINQLYKAPKQWLRDNGIEFYQTPEGKFEPTGQFLRKENVGKYSTKFLKILNTIDECVNNKIGHQFIYSKFVHGTGTRLIRQFLLQNGYLEYHTGGGVGSATTSYSGVKCYYCGVIGREHQEYLNRLRRKSHDELVGTGERLHTYYPARFIVIDSSSEDKHDTKNLIDVYNSNKNVDCELIKIVLGSQIAREAIDFKRIMHVHIVTFDTNFATMEQVIGRGARHCSHADLPPERRKVRIYRYTSSIPGLQTLSAEELKYAQGEQIHRQIKEIERILKTNAVDCSLNIKGNIYKYEIERYKGCETKKNPRLCSPLCDYTNCDYKCAYQSPKTELSFNDLDTSTYDAYHYHHELNQIIRYVCELFKIHEVWDIDSIIYHITDNPKLDGSIYTSRKLPILNFIKYELEYIDVKYVYLALEKIINEQINVKNKFENEGTVIYRGKHYVFQPDELPNTVQIIDRQTKDYELNTTQIGIDSFIQKNWNPSEQKVKYTTIDQIKEKIVEIPQQKFYKIAKIIGELTPQQQISLLESVIELSSQQNLTQSDKSYTTKVFRFFENYLIDNKKFEGRYDYHQADKIIDDLYTQRRKIIGHFLNQDPRCFIDGEWVECVYEIFKRQSTQHFKPNNIITGYIDKTRRGKMVFKLKYTDDKKRDKRKDYKGFICSQHNNKNELFDIANRLGIKGLRTNFTTKEVCERIEENLREREFNERERGSNTKWFYEYIELLRRSRSR